jgi:serine/threonine protein kinase
VRPFASITTSDIANEARVISKLCNRSTSTNIVKITGHGWYASGFSTYYFIDMEFCSKNLDDHIKLQAQNSRLPIHYLEMGRRRPFFLSMMEIFFNHGMEIIRGLNFLHSLGEVHRDLKPQNGNLQFLRLD